MNFWDSVFKIILDVFLELYYVCVSIQSNNTFAYYPYIVPSVLFATVVDAPFSSLVIHISASLLVCMHVLYAYNVITLYRKFSYLLYLWCRWMAVSRSGIIKGRTRPLIKLITVCHSLLATICVSCLLQCIVRLSLQIIIKIMINVYKYYIYIYRSLLLSIFGFFPSSAHFNNSSKSKTRTAFAFEKTFSESWLLLRLETCFDAI